MKKIIGLIREILGAGTIFDMPILKDIGYIPIAIFTRAPGAFLVLAFLVAVQNKVRNKKAIDGKTVVKEIYVKGRIYNIVVK